MRHNILDIKPDNIDSKYATKMIKLYLKSKILSTGIFTTMNILKMIYMCRLKEN